MPLARIEHLLRQNGTPGAHRAALTLRDLLLIVVASGGAYGAVMGSYGSLPHQAVYSAVKVPLLLGASTLICLPSFYVLNALLGLRSDFPIAIRGVLSAQATLSVALASLAPLIIVVYLSVDRYSLAVFSNGIAFLVSTAAAQRTLAAHYAPLIRRDPRHRVGRASWVILYVFVAIQMSWVLRPFVGAPGLDPQFVRPEAWSNAYVKVLVTVWRALSGS